MLSGSRPLAGQIDDGNALRGQVEPAAQSGGPRRTFDAPFPISASGKTYDVTQIPFVLYE